MQNKKYLELAALAAPNGYVVQRYQIDFAKADPDERDFVIRMAEKHFYRSVLDFVVDRSHSDKMCVHL